MRKSSKPEQNGWRLVRICGRGQGYGTKRYTALRAAVIRDVRLTSMTDLPEEKPRLPRALLDRLASTRVLPDVLPRGPMGLFKEWFDEAQAAREQPNPNCMTLATRSKDGVGARIVLCRGMSLDDGYIVFFTNYLGRKGRELAACRSAAAVFHWDHPDRQVRLEGEVTLSPSGESDAYFAARPWESRLSAWASNQSQPLLERGDLVAGVEGAMERLGLDGNELLEKGNATHIPRPEHWGGFRLWCRRVELWIGGPGRLHDRARWERRLVARGEQACPASIADITFGGGAGAWAEGFECGEWSTTRLQP